MFENFNWVDWLTVACVILCYIISGYQVNAHLKYFTNPKFQSKIIMILFMSPIYATLSSFAIWFDDTKGYFLLLRDIYESIVIYSFFELLRACIALDPETGIYDDRRIYIALSKKGPHEHTFPFNYCTSPMNLVNEEEGKKVFERCRNGILQYIPAKAICAFITMLDMWGLGSWEQGEESIYYFCSIFVGISVSVALYWLVFFFHIMHKELEHIKPLMKFITIKGILFVTFWQEIVLYLFDVPLKHSRFLPPQDLSDADEVMSSMLVNIEMVIMSLLTAVAFSHRDFAIQDEMHPHGHITEVLKSNVDETWHQMKETIVTTNSKTQNGSVGNSVVTPNKGTVELTSSVTQGAGFNQGQYLSQFVDHRQGFY